MKHLYTTLLICIVAISGHMSAQEQHVHSVAQAWNEEILNAIRNDFARPTVHARNLFHTSALMYDIWAAYHPNESETYFLGNQHGTVDFQFEGIEVPTDSTLRRRAVEEAISYGMYRMILFRFRLSPGRDNIVGRINALMQSYGYDVSYTSESYQTDNRPAALGNYLAAKIIEFGNQDGSNDLLDYANRHYMSVNPPLVMNAPGNPGIINPNRWQPLSLDVFIDQSGNIIDGATPEFLSPEWGQVTPFALTEEDLTIYHRDSFDYYVYHDPGPPPTLAVDSTDEGYLPEEFLWNHTLVALWANHLDPNDGVVWDISPNSIGRSRAWPDDFVDYRDYYKEFEGGVESEGHRINPATGEPYEIQLVPRGDYARVLAEFWADGPDSETPPGHWFTILNGVMEHDDFDYRWEGQGEQLDTLEYHVKAYFALGGAMHDCAVAAWGIKGWYDYVRPVSAIRYMASKGQSSYPDSAYYHPDGIPLYPGIIEVVKEGDPLTLFRPQNVGKIKLNVWRGPIFVEDPTTDIARVGWILAENWWPYQRPSFVTPPFAGYVSGHSTYSRGAAEVLTLMTGDEYFPGGMGVFEIEKDNFLVFENGPSVDMELQWATYRDASDETSLSRIWGGIHPPVDDIPGRRIGEEIGVEAYAKAREYFFPMVTSTEDQLPIKDEIKYYPNPACSGCQLALETTSPMRMVMIKSISGMTIAHYTLQHNKSTIKLPPLLTGAYILEVFTEEYRVAKKIIITN